MRTTFLSFLLWFVASTLQAEQAFDRETFKTIPIQHDGRVKPMDTIARNSLQKIHGSQSIRSEGRKISPTEWLMDVLMRPEKTKSIKIFRIENASLLHMLGAKMDAIGYFSLNDLLPHIEEVYDHASTAMKLPQKERDHFHNASIQLWEQMTTMLGLMNSFWISEIENTPEELAFFNELLANPNPPTELQEYYEWFQKRYQYLSAAAYLSTLYPQKNEPWKNIGEGLLERFEQKKLHPAISRIANMIAAYQKGNSAEFNFYLKRHIASFNSLHPKEMSRMRFETFFNRAQPFFWGLLLYLFSFILSLLHLIFPSEKLRKTAFGLLVAGFALHTLGILARVWIEQRPPVTSLYTSALFVGWASVCLSIIGNIALRNHTTTLAGSLLGLLTLIIAKNLAGSEDTIQVVRAVLDSNFWLSTHVIAITLGYSIMLLAGSMASIAILQHRLKKTPYSKKEIFSVYSALCLGTLFSFVGTCLGGVWADQSWGRFWGWDPKENGALLIVLWSVIILHARIARIIAEKGLMVMIAFGNIIVSFSWFGVNMIGVGLHSYGFMDKAFLPLIGFMAIQFLICLAGIPIGSLQKIFSSKKVTFLDDMERNKGKTAELN